ncbi:hypothetical protein PspLS_08433 [Pyricularia sp. CBS 133598]|nr:hypothetical protein PspLS_08433 [Pyricularia sp. CBS 133598]
MALPIFAKPVGWLSLSLLLFFLGLRNRAGPLRFVLAILHLITVACGLASTRVEVLDSMRHCAALVIIGATMHTSSILFQSLHISTAQLSLTEQLKATLSIAKNVRRLEERQKHESITATRPHGLKSRLLFGLDRIARVLSLLALNLIISELVITRTLASLPLGAYSFAPVKQVLLPSTRWGPYNKRADLILRAVTCTHWMWSTYWPLVAAYHACAALFVSVLGWDAPGDWTTTTAPIFGSPWEAYTLRRFWGVFWHKLLLAPLVAYTPRALPGELRALCIFVLSAGCHALANWVLYRRACVSSELRFFVSNWAVCLLETKLGLDGGGEGAGVVVASWGRRVAGLGFVWAFFFCVVPAWQYPVVLANLSIPKQAKIIDDKMPEASSSSDRPGSRPLPDQKAGTQQPVPSPDTQEPDDAALPPYEETPPPGQEILAPTTLVLAGQAIHALTTDSPALYRLSLGISVLSAITSEVELSRVDASGRDRLIYDLRHLKSAAGGMYNMPSESPRYYIQRASKRIPGPAAVGLKKTRSLLSRKVTCLPVDPSGKESQFGMPTFVKNAAPILTTDGREWKDAQNKTIALMHDDKDDKKHSLIVTAAMPRSQFDILVALWCCHIWEFGVAHAEKIHEGVNGLKRKLRQSREFGMMYSAAPLGMIGTSSKFSK